MTDLGPCRIVLAGMMGSGKSTVGRIVARATGWPLYDNDELLGVLYGMTARQILEQGGRDELRAAEDAALAAGLAEPGPSIVDAAGGTILSEASRALLGALPVVWLRAQPSTLHQRARGAPHRPWLDDDGEAWFNEAVRERHPLFESVADLIVDTDSASPQESADAILSRLAQLCRA